jgi:hypothetical protein
MIGCSYTYPNKKVFTDEQVSAMPVGTAPKYSYGEEVLLQYNGFGKIKSDPIKSFGLWSYDIKYINKEGNLIKDRFYEYEIVMRVSPELCGTAKHLLERQHNNGN